MSSNSIESALADLRRMEIFERIGREPELAGATLANESAVSRPTIPPPERTLHCGPHLFVYALIDPRTMAVRYVGWATDPKRRLAAHVSAAKVGIERTHKALWIKQLLSLKMRPLLDILEPVIPGDRLRAERRWIKYFRRSVIRAAFPG